MLKKSNFKAKKKSYYYFISASILLLIFFINSIDFRKYFDAELQEFHSFAPSFSTVTQLFDVGDTQNVRSITTSDLIPLSSNLSKSLLDGLLKKNQSPHKEIKIFIKFKHLEKILKDREKAIINKINTNPRNVPCKISDGLNIYKCKVRLKGDLADHWYSIKRMSLRIDVKGGYIHGMKEFAIQKPVTRQFPYDFSFHSFNNMLGRLSSSQQDFFKVTLNGEGWGIMNAEPLVDQRFIEANEVKRLGVFRISNQDAWAYSRTKIKDRYLNYYISDPTINLSMRGNEVELLKDPILNEIYSHIFLSLSNNKTEIFDRKIMVANLIYSLVWGNIHTLENSNTWFTWNPYKKNLEPILTDQAIWQDAEKYINQLHKLPYEYKIILRENPLNQKEFIQELNILDSFFKDNNPIANINSIKKNNFPNDSKFTKTPVYKNLDYLKNNFLFVIEKINSIAIKKSIENTNSIITSDQLSVIDDVAKIIHFTDGTVRIFNLLGVDIKVNKLVANNKETTVNEILSASKADSLSFIDIKTEYTGSFNNSISVIFDINGIKKVNNSTYSITNINYENKAIKTADDYCEYKENRQVCILKGSLIFNANVVFNSKTIIEPGTKIILNKHANLVFNSSVKMIGSNVKPINFEGNNSGAIYIKNEDSQNSIIENTNFINLSTMDSFLHRYTGSVNGYGGAFKFKNVFISNGMAEDQLNIVHAKIDINDLKINNAISDAFDCDFCEGTIQNISFKNVDGDGLDISGSNLDIQQMYAENIKDKAFSVGEKSSAVIKDALFNNVATGIAVKDSSIVKATDISLKNIEYDLFMTYIKKPFYEGPTKLFVNNYTLDGVLKANKCVRERGTDLIIDSKNCNISEIDIDALYQGRMKK